MMRTRARHAIAVAVAVAGLAALPGSAAAHCVDTGGTGMTAAPVPETLSDWTSSGDGCMQPVGSTAAARDLTVPAPAAARTGTLTQVGHEPLMDRGMNAAIAVHGGYAYIGSRTDAHP